MLTEIPADELEMTALEQDLKQVFSLYPDSTKTVFTSEELNQYLKWMQASFGSKRHTYSAGHNISAFPNISRNTDIRDHVLSSQTAPKQPASLPVLKDTVYESQEILAMYDISVGRMLRYFPAHWHANDYFEIYYALSGDCPIYFQDEVITVKPGTVLVVAPSIVHATPCYADDCVLLYYMIRSSTFQQVFWNQLPPDNLMSTFFRQALNNQHPTAYLHFETGSDSQIPPLMYRIYREYCYPERYTAQMLNVLMSAFFVLLLRRYEGTARLPRRSDFFWKHEYSAILTYIQTNFSAVTIQAVAQHFHYSERQIGRIVLNCTGLTFADLILKLRMERAVSMLQQRSASIDTIALSVGYASASTFCRAFAKYYGCTPREYPARSAWQSPPVAEPY